MLHSGIFRTFSQSPVLQEAAMFRHFKVETCDMKIFKMDFCSHVQKGIFFLQLGKNGRAGIPCFSRACFRMAKTHFIKAILLLQDEPRVADFISSIEQLALPADKLWNPRFLLLNMRQNSLLAECSVPPLWFESYFRAHEHYESALMPLGGLLKSALCEAIGSMEAALREFSIWLKKMDKTIFIFPDWNSQRKKGAFLLDLELFNFLLILQLEANSPCGEIAETAKELCLFLLTIVSGLEN